MTERTTDVLDTSTLTITHIDDFIKSYGFEGFYPTEDGMGVEIVISLDPEGNDGQGCLVAGACGDCVATYRYDDDGWESPDDFVEFLHSSENSEEYQYMLWDLLRQLTK